MSIGLLGLVLSGPACVSDPAGSSDSGSTDTGATDGGTGDGGATEDAPLSTPAELEALAAAVFAMGLPAPDLLRQLYLANMGDGDLGCPGDPYQLGDIVGPHGCTAESGAYYRGISTYVVEEGAWLLSGDYEIVDVEGRSFRVGGATSLMGSWSSEAWTAESDVGGSWSYEGQEGPLGQGFSGKIGAMGGERGDSWAIGLHGCVGYAADMSVCLDSFAAAWDDGCDGQGQGGLQIRDGLGRWYQLSIESCDGCAVATHLGQEVGQVCVDSSGLLLHARDLLRSGMEGFPEPLGGEGPG